MTARTAKIVSRALIVVTMVGFAASVAVSLSVLPLQEPGQIVVVGDPTVGDARAVLEELSDRVLVGDELASDAGIGLQIGALIVGLVWLVTGSLIVSRQPRNTSGWIFTIVGAAIGPDVLPRMAQILAEGVGADGARVWLRVGGTLRPDAAWPPRAAKAGAIAIRGDDLPQIPGEDAVAVRHQGEILGALSVQMPASDPMTPAKERLVRDLAEQAGLVLRNVRLIEDLRASRQRLVAAQDEERRKLERNIHDGAQQQLVALAVKLRLTEGLVDKDPAKVAEMLGQLQSEAGAALEDLGDLARGIYPPLLADQGLTAALTAQARKAAIPVAVEADGVGRLPQDVEAAIYFSCLEALQNVAKYAEASGATVTLYEADGLFTFSVTDDGLGFDPNATGYGTGLQGIADRLAALDGVIDIVSSSGTGTSLRGRIPMARSTVPIV
jgi:signal transduction histidine kinase